MCTPFAEAVMAGVSMLSTGLGQIGRTKTAYANALATAQAAKVQTEANMAAIGVRQAQESNRITVEQVRRFAQGRRERASLAARAADAGIVGGSLERDAIASLIQEEIDVGILEANKDMTLSQLEAEKQGEYMKGQSAIGQAQSEIDSVPGTASNVLELISSGVSGYMTGKSLEPRKIDTAPKYTGPTSKGMFRNIPPVTSKRTGGR